MTAPDPRRQLPRTDRVLADPRLAPAIGASGREAVKRMVVNILTEVRRGGLDPAALTSTAVVDLVLTRLPGPTTLRRVINATGVVLHTNLGRAPLSGAARSAIGTAAGYVDVEFDLADGHRARRGRGTLAALRRAVPLAGDVLVVNNGAAALLLATTALATGREVIVSRGEMVEIGDGFRLPDLIASTGAQLREVGTTNRTRLADYAQAIGPGTGCVLKVHPSNFQVVGFTGEVRTSELAGLGVPLIVDTGSGLLAPDQLLPDEPDVTSALRDGADIVTCSADKLLGGPQAGLLLGNASLIETARRHPLARALRVDKLTLAALEATLDGPETPTHHALHCDLRELEMRTSAVAFEVGDIAEVTRSEAAVGGGGAPGLALASWALSLPTSFADRLRQGTPPVVGRVQDGRCLLDLRCVPAADDQLVVAAIRAAAGDTCTS